MPYPFLSPEWVTAAREIRQSFEAQLGGISTSIRINHVITGTPFGDSGTVLAHMDTSTGTLALDLGALEEVDATVTADYETAKNILLSNDPQLTLQAMLTGKLKIDGDSQKVLSLQANLSQIDGAEVIAEKMLTELRALTA
jgi:SCP-2 sterol transfer family